MYRSNLACLVTKMKNILQEFITKQKEKKTESEQNLKIPFSFFPKQLQKKIVLNNGAFVVFGLFVSVLGLSYEVTYTIIGLIIAVFGFFSALSLYHVCSRGEYETHKGTCIEKKGYGLRHQYSYLFILESDPNNIHKNKLYRISIPEGFVKRTIKYHKGDTLTFYCKKNTFVNEDGVITIPSILCLIRNAISTDFVKEVKTTVREQKEQNLDE